MLFVTKVITLAFFLKVFVIKQLKKNHLRLFSKTTFLRKKTLQKH